MPPYKFVLNRKKLVLAPLWRRALAYLIDQLILSFFYIFIMGFISPQLILNMDSESVLAAVIFPLSWLMLFYYSSSEYLFGETIGKKLLGLKVLYDRPNPSLWRYVVRNITKSISTNLLLIDCILMPFDQRRRRLSDFLVGSVVFMSD